MSRIQTFARTSRRQLLAISTLAIAAASAIATPALAADAAKPGAARVTAAQPSGSYITTKDGVQLYYKDWGPRSGQPIVFSHGWPLDSDSWESQMIFLADHGYRVIAHDRRGHGRSSQPWDGNDMDHYADDLATVIETLNLKNAVLVGFSTGGGEVARYIGRHGTSRVAKAVLVSAVPPIMVKSDKNPNGVPKEGLRRPACRPAGQPRPAVQGHLLRPLLRLQPSGCEGVAGPDRQLVAAGHVGRPQEHL